MVKGVVDRFSEEFVETRRKALDKFLKRITDHPVLSFNEHFNVFLTAKVRQNFSYSSPRLAFFGLFLKSCFDLSQATPVVGVIELLWVCFFCFCFWCSSALARFPC